MLRNLSGTQQNNLGTTVFSQSWNDRAPYQDLPACGTRGVLPCSARVGTIELADGSLGIAWSGVTFLKKVVTGSTLPSQSPDRFKFLPLIQNVLRERVLQVCPVPIGDLVGMEGGL
jgi:hypothetical protein